jgi:SAM-dependent methyltransferase
LAELSHDERRRESLERWDHASAGWARHADWIRDSSAALSRRLIDALELEPGQTLLELAAGTGDTGFLAAERLAPSGKLISSDNSQAMSEVAQLRVRQLDVANVAFRLINAESIDLPVASVDAVLCRWGLMLFIDPAAALGEMRRVLKPGGRVALAVWAGPDRNHWLSVPDEVVVSHGLVPAPRVGEPGPFALGDRGQLAELIAAAGFVDVEVEEVEVERGAQSFRDWWERQLDMSTIGVAVRAAPAEVQQAVAAEVRERISDFTGVSLMAVAS